MVYCLIHVNQVFAFSVIKNDIIIHTVGCGAGAVSMFPPTNLLLDRYTSRETHVLKGQFITISTISISITIFL